MNFIWDIYRELNPDLVKAGLRTPSDFEKHFKQHGIQEKRSYTIYQAYPDFHPIQYQINYPDLRNLNGIDLEKHWLFIGRHQKRIYTPPKEVTKVEPIQIVEKKVIKTEHVPPVTQRREKKESIPEPTRILEKEVIKTDPIPPVRQRREKKESIPEPTRILEKEVIKTDPIPVVIQKKEKDFIPEVKPTIVKDITTSNIEKEGKGSIFNKMNLKQIYISPDLGHLDRICSIYNLVVGRNISNPILLFGLYNLRDYEVLTSHRSDVYIMWGGTDECILQPDIQKFIVSSPHVYHIAISKDIQSRLQKKGFSRITYVPLDLTNRKVFVPVQKKGDKIFIYNGYNKGQEQKYGKAIYEQVMDRLPQYEYILSNELGGIPNEKMADVYRECFIGLRLTEHDGNANMVGELCAMKIPVIHNISDYGLKWKTVEDVISLILENCTNDGTCLDLFHSPMDIKQLPILYRNIGEFTEKIKKYNNILFISSDYPGYGGAATNCYALQQFFKKDHRVYGVYYNFDGDPHRKIETSLDFCIVDENKMDFVLKTLQFRPDLIILKNFVNKINVKSLFSCPVFYLVPGIYLNGLDRHVDQLTKKEDHQQFINQSVLKQIVNSDQVFCNSNHTRMILKRVYNLSSKLFYSSLINYYGKERIEDPDFNGRMYDYAIISSSFNRPIKNIIASINAVTNKENVLLIGKGCTKWNKNGFTCLESVRHFQMQSYYKKIKYVIQDSFYESCSNVKIEAWFNGCNVITSKDPILHKKKEVDTVLNKKEIHIIDTYDEHTYPVICETVELFNKFNIKLYYLLFSNQTQLIHDHSKQIRIQDTTKQYQINNLIEKWLGHSLEQVFYSEKISVPIVDLIAMFKHKNVLNTGDFQKIIQKKITLFVNFKCSDIPYGGGNQFIMNLVKYLESFPNIRVTYQLESKIDIYFIIDIRKGPFKQYSFQEIYHHKQQNGGMIIYRINDCDITREKCTLENMIVENIEKIDYLVFNSRFIKDFYVDKYDIFSSRPSQIIYNTANTIHFYPKPQQMNTKLRIVTHHWSDNTNKGYQFYYDLHEYCRSRKDIEFVMFGRKFADGFTNPPTVQGPYKGQELGDRLRECDIYITASKYDSCPMHLLEGLACGLPVLYLDHPGGVKDICERSVQPIGESFGNMEECIQKIEKIKKNYDWYYKNIKNNLSMYGSEECYAEYTKLFMLQSE